MDAKRAEINCLDRGSDHFSAPSNDHLGQHVHLLHKPSQPGFASISGRIEAGRWRDLVVPIRTIEAVAREYVASGDLYLSASSFFKTRRAIAQLRELSACYVDLDYYRSKWAENSPDEVLRGAFWRLKELDLPLPSFAVWSGRGIQLVWLFEATVRMALPRWNACQKLLWGGLTEFGADRAALDAARVLRLAGTVNSKSGRMATLLWVDGAQEAPTFDELANQILPLTREQLVSLRAERARRRALHVDVRAFTPARTLTKETWAETVLTDVQRLRHYWWADGMIPSGSRDQMLFVSACMMAWLAPPQVMRREIIALAEEIAGWSLAETKSRMSAVFGRASAAAAGHKIEFMGREVDPRYKFKADTLVEWLGVSDSDMRAAGLRGIVSPDVRRENRAAAKVQERAARGATSRAETEKANKKLVWEARKLIAGGRSQTQAASIMGVNRPTLVRLLKKYK